MRTSKPALRSALDGAVIASGALDGDDHLQDAVPAMPRNDVTAVSKPVACVRQPSEEQGPGRRSRRASSWNEPSRNRRDHAELLRPYRLDTRMENAPWLVNDVRLSRTTLLRRGLGSHGTGPPNRVEKRPNSHSGSLLGRSVEKILDPPRPPCCCWSRIFSTSLRHIPGERKRR